MQYLVFVAAFVACYIFGAIPFGVIVGKVTRGVDIRSFGSGNIGFANVLRTLGPGPGLAVFLLDTGKGLAAVELCRWLGMNDYLTVVGGVLSLVGHCFSVFLKFQGGRAVATSLGMMVGLTPVIAGIAFVLWVLLVGITRYISVASILAALSVSAMVLLWKPHIPVPYQVVAVMATALIVLKHTSNIRRLMNGTESKVGQRVKLESKEGEDG